MSKRQPSPATQHVRGQLQQHLAVTDTALRHAHAHMVASLQPALHTLLRDLETARATATDEDGESTLTLAWLHEGNRLKHFSRTVTQAVNHFGLTTQITVEHATQKAKALGEQSARAQLGAMKAKGKK